MEPKRVAFSTTENLELQNTLHSNLYFKVMFFSLFIQRGVGGLFERWGSIPKTKDLGGHISLQSRTETESIVTRRRTYNWRCYKQGGYICRHVLFFLTCRFARDAFLQGGCLILSLGWYQRFLLLLLDTEGIMDLGFENQWEKKGYRDRIQVERKLDLDRPDKGQ